MGFTDETKLVGIVGRIFPIKNHNLFLKSAARIAAHQPMARFIIVGDGILRSTLVQKAHELGIIDRVVFTGWRRDLPRIYADLDVLVISSDNEGTPVSAIEAMASGCPVVATRVGGLPDLITDKESGFLVRRGDADGIASAVVNLLQHPEMGKGVALNAMTAAQSRFALKRLIADMDRLYSHLLEKKSILVPSAETRAMAHERNF
jgi:glycosyltransferase involved in cell wall biosynthesis